MSASVAFWPASTMAGSPGMKLSSENTRIDTPTSSAAVRASCRSRRPPKTAPLALHLDAVEVPGPGRHVRRYVLHGAVVGDRREHIAKADVVGLVHRRLDEYVERLLALGVLRAAHGLRVGILDGRRAVLARVEEAGGQVEVRHRRAWVERAEVAADERVGRLLAEVAAHHLRHRRRLQVHLHADLRELRLHHLADLHEKRNVPDQRIELEAVRDT